MKKDFSLVRLLGAVIMALALTGLTAGLEGCKKKEAQKTEPEKKESPASADLGPAIPFKIKTFDGKEFNTEDKKGKLVVVNFFASWCGPCKEEAPVFVKAHSAFKDLGVEFVGVAIDDTEEGAREFIKRYKITFPAGLDANNEIGKAYKLYGVPDTFIIGRDGRYKFMRTGSITEEELVGEIRKAL